MNKKMMFLIALALPFVAHAAVQKLVLTNQYGEQSDNFVQSPMVSSLIAGSNISISGGLGNFTISGSGGGSGTVTSVALSGPSIFSTAGSPITTSGTITQTLVTQTQNKVLASPTGSTGTPTFRLLDPLDIPSLLSTKISDFSTAVNAIAANIQLSNVASTSIGADLVPASPGAVNLGDFTHAWGAAVVQSLVNNGSLDIHAVGGILSLQSDTGPATLNSAFFPTVTDTQNIGSGAFTWNAGFFHQFQLFSAGDQKGYLIWDEANSLDLVSNFDLLVQADTLLTFTAGTEGFLFNGDGPINIGDSSDIKPVNNNQVKLGIVGKEFSEVHTSNLIGNNMTINAAVGPINFASHLKSTNSVAAVSSCGTSPSISGTDTTGKVTVGSGGVATSCTVTFASAYTSAPHCFVNDQTDIVAVQVVPTTTNFVINVSIPFTAGALLDYFCIAN